MQDAAVAMPSFVKLLVANLEKSAQFYEALGFTVDARDPVFVRLLWPAGGRVYLVATPAGVSMEGRRGTGVLLCFPSQDPGVERVAGRARLLDATVDGPREQPWHTREAVVVDPDGYRLNFVEPL